MATITVDSKRVADRCRNLLKESKRASKSKDALKALLQLAEIPTEDGRMTLSYDDLATMEGYF